MATAVGWMSAWAWRLRALLLPLRCPALNRTSARIQVALVIGAGALTVAAFSFWKKKSKGWAVSYSVTEDQESKQCLLGQEVTLRCSMEGTFPDNMTATWRRIHSEDRTVPESAGDQESPEHQPLLPTLPPGWTVTEERAGTRLTSALTFTPTVQDDRVRVWKVKAQRDGPRIHAGLEGVLMVTVAGWVGTWASSHRGWFPPPLFRSTEGATFTHTSTWTRAVLGIVTGAVGMTVAALYYRKKRSGWAASYSLTEVQGSEQCRPGQEVTLHCSMEGTSPENIAMTCERVHSEDRTVPESTEDQESPEHQTLIPALPQHWRVTEEIPGTRITSYTTFTPTVQNNRAQVWKVKAQRDGPRIHAGLKGVLMVTVAGWVGTWASSHRGWFPPPLFRSTEGATFTHTSTWTRAVLGIVTGAVGMTVAALYYRKKRSGWAASYAITEVQGSEQFCPGQEVTLHCSMEGTSPEKVAMACERVQSKDRTVPESTEDQESPEHQTLLPILPQGWRVTEERSGNHLMSSLTFTPIVQGNGAWVQYVLLQVAKQAIGERVSLEIGVCDDLGPAPLRSPVLRPPGWAVSYNVAEVQVPERCLLGQELTLRCSMEGTFPEDVAVTWERIHSEDRTVPESAGDQESPEHQPLIPALPPGWRMTEERAGTRLTSCLTFTPTVQDDTARVRCLFLHEGKQIREERVSPEIRVWAQPQVSEIQVWPEWDPRDKVPFAVQLHNFYPREVPPIQWGWDGAGSWGADPAQIDKNADGTFTATSVWRVPSQSLTRPELRVRVCVQHGPGEPPSERELSLRAAGLLQPPEVSEISRTESVAKGKGVTLSCRIAGHFPGELSVTWLRRGKGEPTAVILRDSAEWRVEPGTAVLARDGKSFQQETRLTRWTSRDKGAEYMCRVGHLALETPIERSSACHLHPPDLGKVSQQQDLVPGQPVTVQSFVSGTYPRQLAMAFLGKKARKKEARPLENSDPPSVLTPVATWAPDEKSSRVESELCAPSTEPEDDGVKNHGHVEHEALKEPKSRSSEELQHLGHSESPEPPRAEEGGGS